MYVVARRKSGRSRFMPSNSGPHAYAISYDVNKDDSDYLRVLIIGCRLLLAVPVGDGCRGDFSYDNEMFLFSVVSLWR